MELTSKLLRARICLRYLRVILTFTVFFLFIILFHRSRAFTKLLPDLTENNSRGESRHVLSRIVSQLPVGQGRYDNSRMLRIYDFIRVGAEWEKLIKQYDICLATQSSIERIYWLPQILAHWKGPLSLAIYIISEEEWIILNFYLAYVTRCYHFLGSQTSIHVAVPASADSFCLDELCYMNSFNKTSIETVEKVKLHSECRHDNEYIEFLLTAFPITSSEKLKLKEIYPQNHLRNIARKACGTHWTLSTDIDIIPSIGMAEALQIFYGSVNSEGLPCKKCAYVIPTFELDERRPFPSTKRELIEHVNSGKARQFHVNFYKTGHMATNYFQWTSTNLDDEPVKISHPITSSKTFLYEPFYVSPDDIPTYDERLIGYGFTRNSQFQEALYAGWNFTVLTPVFAIHWGLQTAKTLLSPKERGVGKNVRDKQKAANYKIFTKLLKKMKLQKEEGLY